MAQPQVERTRINVSIDDDDVDLATEMAEPFPTLQLMANWIKLGNTTITSRHEDVPSIKVYRSRTLLDKLTCSFCRKYLSVGPIHCEKTRGLRACGRCVKQQSAEFRRFKMQPDHLYESLLQHFEFPCSHKSCDVNLRWSNVEDHEARCIFGLHIIQALHYSEPNDSGNEDEAIFVKIPDVWLINLKLSCSLCKKPLSVFPVISNGRLVICGRCERPNYDTWTEQLIYAHVAKFIKFNCKNINCKHILRIDEVDEHETNCRWMLMLCFCGQRILAAEMSLHVRTHHLDDCPDRLEVKEQTSLFKIDHEPYLVLIEALDQNQLSCSVYGLDDIDYDSLLLEIVDGNSAKSLRIQVANLQHQHKSNQVLFERRLNAFIRFVRAADVEGIALDEETSERFECKVCYTHMTRRIFVCENNHAICDRCKLRVASCPMCRGVLADRSHAAFETEAANFRFPCALQAVNGCGVALTPKSLARHEVRCKPPGYVPSESCLLAGCRVKLHAQQFDEIFNHFAKHHDAGLVIYSGNKETIAWTSTQDRLFIKCRVVFFDGEYFLVTMYRTVANSGIYCVIQLVTGTGCKRYKFTLELDGDGWSVEMKGTCSPFLSTAMVAVKVNPEVVRDMVNVQQGQQDGVTINWLNYRVKLEEHFDIDDNDDFE